MENNNFKYGEFSYLNKEPFHYEGPTILRKRYSYATQIPKNRKLDYPITAIATQFRLNQFNELYKKLENNKQRSLYFGSNAPFLYFANNTYFLNNENETIEYSIERSKKVKKALRSLEKEFISQKVYQHLN